MVGFRVGLFGISVGLVLGLFGIMVGLGLGLVLGLGLGVHHVFGRVRID